MTGPRRLLGLVATSLLLGACGQGGTAAPNDAAGGNAMATGGMATGGMATGGMATGGMATGGTATGGTATGGTATGGTATGGTATGGVATAGSGGVGDSGGSGGAAGSGGSAGSSGSGGSTTSGGSGGSTGGSGGASSGGSGGSPSGGSGPGSVVPDPPPGYHWEVVPELTDEFDGNTLDATKWDDYHPHWSGRAPSQFLRGNCFVRDGMMNLRSTLMRDPSTVSDPFSDIWVNAAACVSKEKSAYPGYFYEAKMKASSLSMTSSFWFRVGAYSEIDVIEHIGNPSVQSRQDDLPYEYHANTHFYGTQPAASKGAGWTMPTRGRDEFHVFGFWWKDPNNLWFYHNGTKVMEIVPNGSAAENLKLIFDTEVFPFATAGVANIGLPLVENLNDDSMNTMYVDWVHAFRLVPN